MAYQIFDQEEVDKINKNKDSNDRMEEFFNTARSKWNEEIKPLTETLKSNFNLESAKIIVDVQASSLAYRQNINEEISFYMQKRSKENIKFMRLTQEKLFWYSLGESPLGISKKLTSGQLSSVIESHTAEAERGVKLFDTHLEFLRSTAKGLSDLGYNINKIIELHNYISKN
jgi:ATP-dependent Lon protease